MRLSPAQILFLSLQLVTVCDEALHNLTPFLADRTILFLQLLTDRKSSESDYSILASHSLASIHSSRLFESTVDSRRFATFTMKLDLNQNN